MNNILIRVTIDEGLYEDVLLEYLGKYNVIGCKEYPHNNPHYHFWLQTHLKHDTVQKFIRDKCFASNVDRKNRKFSVKTGDSNLKYLCKGPLAVSKIKSKDYPGKKAFPEIVINTFGVTKEDIVKNHELWWEEAEQFLETKMKSTKVTKENKEKVSWFQVLINNCKLRGIDYRSDGWAIAAAIIDCYVTCFKCEPNDFQIKSYAKSIQAQLVYEHSKETGDARYYERYLEHRARSVIGPEWTRL